MLATAITFANDRFGDHAGQPKSGFYPELSNMITGSGWVSLGPGYRQYFADDHAFIDTSAALSWRLYKMGQVRFEMPRLAGDHLAVGTQAMWQDNTQVNYFGVGSNTSENAQSQYRMRNTDAVGYGVYRPWQSLSIGGELGYLIRPDVSSPAGTFKPSVPDTPDAFPFDPAARNDFQPNYLHGEASITSDTRDYRGRPTRGGLYRAAMTGAAEHTRRQECAEARPDGPS